MDFSPKLILALLPIILINISLVIWCFVDWWKREKFRYFPKMVWLIIFLFIQLIGPVSYLLFGRDHDSN